jgi:hypothetical protein
VSRTPAAKGRKYGFMESIYREDSPKARRFTANSIPCPNPECGAAAGEACSDTRVCPERLHEALDLLRAGQIPEAPEPAQDTVAEPCDACQVRKTQRGSPKFCGDPAHRCSRIIPRSQKQCAAPVVPGTRYCGPHTTPQRRWTDTATSKRWN